MTDNTSSAPDTLDAAVAQGGAYEVLRSRLTQQGSRLATLAGDLNSRRVSEFGDSKMAQAGRFRIRSEQNAIGRDVVQVGPDLLLFGYNVFLGLKSTTSVADVFALHKLVPVTDGYDATPVDAAGTFLADPLFVRDFDELYTYYKDATLVQLSVKDSKLLAAFRIGGPQDLRVFRWSIASTGEISYLDARGDRDIALPPTHDFEWIKAGKDREVSGRFPHLNILDTVFVETTGGDLTIKVENSTDTGAGIYSEPVEDRTQSLDDAQFYYARLGSLILLKILPYREIAWRGLVFNTMTQQVTRLDAIVEACVQLPEDHGIIFPGGYVLQNGEQKAFDGAITQMRYKRTVLSPNGEDVLYIFYEPDAGQSALLVYNMIQRRVMPPILAHGHARLPDGRMVLFHDETSQPTRVHQMQVWDTPFFSDEYAAAAPAANSAFGRIGNPELVRTISDLFDIARDIEQEDVTVQRYEALAHATRRLFDIHPWITDAVADGLAGLLHEITETAESVLDEFQKVQEIRQQSEVALTNASAGHRSLMGRLQPEGWARLEQFVEALHEVSRLRGQLLTIRDMRYIDVPAVDAMVTSLDTAHDQVGAATAAFLLNPKALAPFDTRLNELEAASGKAATANQLAEVLRGMQTVAADLDMLSELMAGLKVDDATKRTQVVDAIAALYARLNQAKARTDQRRKTLGSSEAVAQFGAQFALFSQSVANSLGMATTPEKADEQLSRLMVQLEELEGQFGEHEQFLGDILTKREELLEAFETHKQALLDERQRKAASLLDAANRILDGLGRRTERFDNADDLNAFFAGDPLIQKLRDLCARLRDLRDTVKADDIEARIKAARDQAVRGMRDRTELFDEGGNVIKLGPRHRFSVNTQALDLTLLQRGDAMTVHLTGTDFMESMQDDGLDGYRHYWPVALESESPQLYRGEYLAGQVLDAARRGEEGLTTHGLQQSLTDEAALAKLVRDYAAPRYRDGYEKGIHDADATQILKALVRLQQGAGALVYLPQARALAVAFWAAAERETWAARINAANAIDALGGGATARAALRPDLIARLNESLGKHDLGGAHLNEAADYLLRSVTAPDAALPVSSVAAGLVDRLEGKRADKAFWSSFTGALKHLEHHPAAAWSLATQAITSLLAAGGAEDRFVPEAVAMFLGRDVLKFESSSAPVSTVVEGLLGQHPSIEQGRLRVAVDDFNARYRHHAETFVPGFRDYQALRAKVIAREREAMRLEEFKPKPLTSFVRNRLINDVYLALIGDNLAKQIGTVGEGKRSDLMGLLMLISPPGYGKTTLMEYVANRLGLIFMKVNGPALGHGVRSLDPAQAPDATSRRELEKLNLALEMGSNVMLYVDDIQHTHPEFLQKFISLCDGTRRIEGVWRGQTKTYDMRGKKFAVIMAGNPYTESGEVFKIPDMLANRADIYNLGDVLGGMEATFLLSYIENCLTSNPVLAPLATRDMADLYLLADKSLGKDVSTNNLSHAYSAAEINEITSVLQRLVQVRDVVYRVNQQYILSAAQADKYRTEPPFKLQGSYRNMNKLAEKISPVMNDAELQQLITDHYRGESQLLTTGAEENLLKLGELRGTLTADEAARWAQIKADFVRNKAMGGDDADVGQRMVAQLADIASGVQGLSTADAAPAPVQEQAPPWKELLAELSRISNATPPPAPAPAAQEGNDEPHPALVNDLFDVLRATLVRQDMLHAAVLDLLDATPGQIAAPAGHPEEGAPVEDDTGEPRRPLRVRTKREREFDRMLANLRFRHETPPGTSPE